MLVVVPSEEFTAEAKEVLPAIRPLKINEAVQINIVMVHLFFPPFLETVKRGNDHASVRKNRLSASLRNQQAVTHVAHFG